MTIAATLLLPALCALALCLHLGYAWSRLALPADLAPLRALLMPLLGLALLLCATAAITTATALTPPQAAAGLALLALPLNLWAWHRGRRRPPTADRGPTAEGQHIWTDQGAAAHNQWSVVRGQWPVVALAAGVWLLAVLPALGWGVSTPIGDNWDAAEFYVPLGRALQLAAQRDLAALPQNPLVTIFSIPPVDGRIHAFSYLHAAVSSATGVEPLRSFVPLMALVLALQIPAGYALARTLGLGRAALLAALLLALAWLPLWVSYNGFSNHVMGLPFVPLALASSLVALRSGGWAALATGGLCVAALATGYYPAVSVYLLLLAPAGLCLLFGAARGGGQAFLAGLGLSPQTRPAALLGRAAALAALAALFSAAAQVYFFFRQGFLGEVLRGGAGYQIFAYVPLADALGLEATFRKEPLAGVPWLVLPAAGLALLLGAAALLNRRTPLLAALALGAALFQAYTISRNYYYGFYKGVTFELPVYTALIAAGASALWHAGAGSWRALARAAAALALALIVGLNAATLWRVQARYAERPRLWTIAETDLAAVRAEVGPDASVLVVPSSAHPPTFNSLISYALLGHRLFGNFATGYNALDERPGEHIPDLALLPDGTDPASYGYRADEVRWAGAGMRLYGRPAEVRYHRALGTGGRFPAIAPGESLTLRVAPDRIALPHEREPAGAPPEQSRLALAVASFAPSHLEMRGAVSEDFALSGGLFELVSAPLSIPAAVELRNGGDAPLYLWWSELRDPAASGGATPRDEAFVQLLPGPPSDGGLAADLRLRTQPLPDGPQKLTGLVTVSHMAKGQRSWREVGQWVFFPNGDELRLEFDPTRLQAALRRAGQPADLFGAAQPAGDGRYQVALLLANNAQIIYGSTVWNWEVVGGALVKPSADAVLFEVLPLPRPATSLDIKTDDSTMRLRGYTLPQRRVRGGETVTPYLVWQSLRRIDSDLVAHVILRDRAGRTLAEQSAPLGRPEHGTSTWQEGELADVPVALALPRDLPPGPATLTVELRRPDGTALPFDGGRPALDLLELEVAR